MGLGQNVSDISGSSNSRNSNPVYSEPNLANQFVYDMMLRIPGEGIESANLLERRKSKKGDDTFEKTSSVRNINNNIWKPNETALRGKSAINT